GPMNSVEVTSAAEAAISTVETVAVTKVGNLGANEPSNRGEIGVVEFPTEKLGPEDIRIKVAYAAICGSDPHLAEGFFTNEVPIGLGHEISGTVLEIGDEVKRTDLRVGDRVSGNFVHFCGSCLPCRDGRQQFCEHLDEYNRPGMARTIVW